MNLKMAQACALAGGAGPRKSLKNSSHIIASSADKVKPEPLLRFLIEPDFKNFLSAFPHLSPAGPASARNTTTRNTKNYE